MCFNSILELSTTYFFLLSWVIARTHASLVAFLFWNAITFELQIQCQNYKRKNSRYLYGNCNPHFLEILKVNFVNLSHFDVLGFFILLSGLNE